MRLHCLYLMPDNKQSTRTIKGNQPARTISYAPTTKPYVQDWGSNKTAEFLADIDPQDPGRQGFYREALMLPNPLDAKQQMNYGQLQQLMKGPQAPAVLEAYRATNRLDKAPSPQEYQQTMFDAAHQQLIERGANNPGAYAFPDAAVEALRAPTSARLIRTGNFASGEQPGQVVNPAMLAQRAAELPKESGTYTAPGMPVRLIRDVSPAPAFRVIRGYMGNSIAGR
jgi:hypothetical protein